MKQEFDTPFDSLLLVMRNDTIILRECDFGLRVIATNLSSTIVSHHRASLELQSRFHDPIVRFP